jgi:hypothetical protein
MGMDEEVARLHTLLDHYRGTCDICGREGVLLDFALEFDSYAYENYLDRRCWVDPQECQRVAYERWHVGHAERSAAAQRGWETRRRLRAMRD